jgi:hypothetical protein
VVVLKDGIGDDEVSAHMSTVRDLFADHGNNNTHNVLMHEYKFEGFCGYGAKMDDKLVDYFEIFCMPLNGKSGVMINLECLLG